MSVPPDQANEQLSAAVHAGLAASGTPGAAVVWLEGDHLDIEVAAGTAAQPADQAPVAMTVDAVADVASITKLAVTTVVAARLHARGQLPLDAPIERWLPVRGPGTAGLTVDHLLTHRSGHADWLPLAVLASHRDRALDIIAGTTPPAPPGTVTRYSDIGMILLGAVLEEVTATRLDELAQAHLVEPLELQATGYGPRHDAIVASSDGNPVERRMLAERHPALAAAEPPAGWRTSTLIGQVNDANAAHAFAGIAGHAGLFSSARDLARIGAAMLSSCRGDDRWLPGGLVRHWTTPGLDPRCGRGWLTRRVATSVGPPPGLPGDPPTAQVIGPDTSFGHRGFTGCELLVEPRSSTVVTLVSNRLHGVDEPRDHAALWLPVLQATIGCKNG